MAATYFKRAAGLGNVDAILELGTMYEDGDGVRTDIRKAMQLYRMAANRGDATAQCNLATMLLDEGSDESQREAFEYYKLSAAQGFTSALYQVGFCYVHGAGTEVDFVEGKRWLERAAAKGDKAAVSALEILASST